MRVFPVLDLQVAEFRQSESAPWRWPSRVILRGGGRFAEHSSNETFTPICARHRALRRRARRRALPRADSDRQPGSRRERRYGKG